MQASSDRGQGGAGKCGRLNPDWAAVQFHRPTVKRNEMTRDRKPQSDPACDATILLERHKWFEDTFLLFTVNSEACICYPKMDMRRRNLRTQCDLSALCIFFCIAQQVQKYLAQADGIRPDLRQTFRNIYFPLNVRRCGLIGKIMERIHQQLMRVKQVRAIDQVHQFQRVTNQVNR